MDAKTIIKTLGGATEVARCLGLPADDVGAKAIRAWSFRNRIPGDWFAAIERVAIEKGHPEITLDVLAKHAERRRLQKSAPEQAAA